MADVNREKSRSMHGKLKNEPAKTMNSALPKLKMLVTVVDRSKADLYMDLLEAFEVNMQLLATGSGTGTTSEAAALLGLGDKSKAVLFSLVREDMANKALDMLEEKFRTVRNGKGIAFTVPLSSVVGVAIYSFLSNTAKDAR